MWFWTLSSFVFGLVKPQTIQCIKCSVCSKSIFFFPAERKDLCQQIISFAYISFFVLDLDWEKKYIFSLIMLTNSEVKPVVPMKAWNLKAGLLINTVLIPFWALFLLFTWLSVWKIGVQNKTQEVTGIKTAMERRSRFSDSPAIVWKYNSSWKQVRSLGKTMKDGSNHPNVLRGKEEPLDYFSASVGLNSVYKNISTGGCVWTSWLIETWEK